MGQATLDLPESAPKAGAAASSADELLSQLAGQEIDRLLADADAKGTAEVAPPPPPIEELNLNDPSTATESAQSSATTIAPAPAVEKTPATAAAPATEDAYAEQVDQLFKQLKITPGVDDRSTVPPEPAAPVEESTSAAEKAALAPAPPVEEVTVQQVLEQVDAIPNTPIYVRALELLNSPFNFCPDDMRDTLGKVAILTMMNSIGVLLYVILFRKH